MKKFQISDIMTINMTSKVCLLFNGVAYEYYIDTAILNRLMEKYKKSPGRLFNKIKKLSFDWNKL